MESALAELKVHLITLGAAIVLIRGSTYAMHVLYNQGS